MANNVYKVTRGELTVTHKNGKMKKVDTSLLTSLWSDYDKAVNHARWHCQDFQHLAEKYKVAQVTGEPYMNVYVRVDTYTERDGRYTLELNGTYHVAEVEDGKIYNRYEED